MEKGEFMPGSFLKVNSSKFPENTIVKVIDIKNSTVTVISGSNQEPKEVSYDELTPIPVKDIVSRLRLKSKPYLGICNEKLIDAFEYIHQLQALIYMMIGEEVTMKDF